MSTADFIRRRRIADFDGDHAKAIASAQEELTELGCTFFRASVTPMTHDLILEGWRQQPVDQGDVPV